MTPVVDHLIVQLAITTVLSQAVKIDDEVIDSLIFFLSLVKFGPPRLRFFAVQSNHRIFSLLSHTS